MSEDRAEWNYTLENNIIGLKNDPRYEEPSPGRENGRFAGRPVIGRDTPIDGGVYLVGGIGEACVVDSIKQPKLNEVYGQLLRTIEDRKQRGENYKSCILDDVFALVRERMPYDLARTEEVSRHLKGTYGTENVKYPLGGYVDAGGVCRHQALLAGFLLEKLKYQGYVRGHVSVDRNHIQGVGGHAWVRYTTSDGRVFIIDPAQNFCGSIEEAKANQERWSYERPEASKLVYERPSEKTPKWNLKDFLKDLFGGRSGQRGPSVAAT